MYLLAKEKQNEIFLLQSKWLQIYFSLLHISVSPRTFISGVSIFYIFIREAIPRVYIFRNSYYIQRSRSLQLSSIAVYKMSKWSVGVFIRYRSMGFMSDRRDGWYFSVWIAAIIKSKFIVVWQSGEGYWSGFHPLYIAVDL